MMKFLFILLMMKFLINNMLMYLMQFMYQFMIYFMMFVYMIGCPLSDLNYWMKIYYFLGYDFYSVGLILLSLWIMSLVMMVNMNNNKYNYIIYYNIMNLILIFLILCFMSISMILFYLFFEISLIPIFMLILGWGFQVDRIKAGFYMMLYTLLGSYPLFYFIMMMYNKSYSLMYMMNKFVSLNLYMYMMMLMAFLIKMPMYLFHMWLPKAHVEAPLVGSMILAGVMLKLGSYGLMRFMLMSVKVSIKFNKFIMVISLIGGVYASLMCLSQIDMKMLVAYSSIVHMSVLMSSMMTLFSISYWGSLMMMISHGICSSGLFCLVNINYERLCSRSLIICKGMINFFPILSLFWFLMCSSNLSFPPSLNFFSEILLLSSLLIWSKYMMMKLMLILFVSTLYTLYLYSFSQHGMFSKLIYYMKGVLLVEYMNLLLHWVPLNLLFFIMYMFM